MKDLTERKMWRTNGFAALVLVLAAIGAAVYWLILEIPAIEATEVPTPGFFGALALLILGCFCAGGFLIVQPNEAKVFTLFGRYSGSIREAGFHFTNPFTKRKSISLKARNFGSQVLKVNDALGNPIEIGAIVVWRVTDSAKALYNVDAFESFVTIQSETALRVMASRFPYDTGAPVAGEHPKPSLRGSQDEVARELRDELQVRLAVAGVTVDEARLSHLAYAPEIAQAMLRRQQAEAVIAARRLIVDGAVGMVRLALHDLEEQGVVKLDNERRAAMVNNLLVALVSESEAQPIINTGTLYA
jgi:regulator of protease activity HflC (stomatin/prohibitin superfamily)